MPVVKITGCIFYPWQVNTGFNSKGFITKGNKMDQREIMEEDEINLLDYFRVVWKYRKTMIAVFFAVTIITLINNVMAPVIYQSTASVLPPEIENKGAGALSQISQGLVGRMLPNLSAGGSTTNTVIAMLKSRRMANDIIEKFNLKKLWEQKFVSDTIRDVQGGTSVEISQEGVISITVESTDKQLAADIANFYVSNLNRMNEELELSSAKPVVRILDVAKPAEKKSKPTIRKNVMLSGIAALFLGIFIAFLLEYLDKLKIKDSGSKPVGADTKDGMDSSTRRQKHKTKD